MSFETIARAGFSAIIAAHSDLAVTVRYRSQTATGLRVLVNKQTAPGEYGQAGTSISSVRVRSDQIDEPERGANLTIDGQQAYVLECRTSGGIRVIECSDTQPIEGV